MNELRILGIQIYDRVKESGRTQKVLTEYGHCIKTRLGFHELNEAINSRVGFILLELAGKQSDWDNFEAELAKIGGLAVKKMSFQL